MGFLAVVLVVWLMSKVVTEARIDHAYARQGLVSPRLETKYGSRDKAAAMVAKYGPFDYLRDSWRDYWPRRTAAMVAARDARAADGTSRVRFRDRLAAGRDAVTRVVQPPPAAANPALEQPQPQPVFDPDVPEPDTDPAETEVEATPDPKPKPEPTTPKPTAPSTNGGSPMTSTSGEVVNFETAIAVLDGMIADVRLQIDAARAALDKMADAKTAVDELQQTYQPTAEAAQTKLDHEAALNLDGTTLGYAGTTVDALPPNAVDGLYDQVELVEQMTNDRLVQGEVALAALEAQRAHVVATYGDAHATVAGNLGGDSRFLDSGGPGAAATSAQPAAVGAR
jgi:hypothetical protein